MFESDRKSATFDNSTRFWWHRRVECHNCHKNIPDSWYDNRRKRIDSLLFVMESSVLEGFLACFSDDEVDCFHEKYIESRSPPLRLLSLGGWVHSAFHSLSISTCTLLSYSGQPTSESQHSSKPAEYKQYKKAKVHSRRKQQLKKLEVSKAVSKIVNVSKKWATRMERNREGIESLLW